jgi:hypothetical protein
MSKMDENNNESIADVTSMPATLNNNIVTHNPARKQKKHYSLPELIEKAKQYVTEVYGGEVRSIVVESVVHHMLHTTSIGLSFQAPVRAPGAVDDSAEVTYERKEKILTIDSKMGVVEAMRKVE